jgi:carbonic anhydrase
VSEPSADPRASATTTDELVAANEEFAATFDTTRAGCDLSSPRPTRHITVITCMDARIDLFAALGLSLGEVHLIRNAGGIVTDDSLRSLTLSQHALGTREVVVVHHTEAATGSRPPFAFGGFADIDESVRASVSRLRATPFLLHRDAVRGFVYDVATGHLREVT